MYFSILKRPMKKTNLPVIVLCLAQLFCLAQITFQKTTAWPVAAQAI
jgi:hypothetical protein